MERLEGPGEPSEHVYRLSRDARRTVLVLLVALGAIAAYAVWTLGSLLTGGVQGPEWATAALMLAVLGLTPAVAWALLAELNVTIVTDDQGLTYRTLGGVNLAYPWPQVEGLVAGSAGLRSLSNGDKAPAAGRKADAIPAESGVTAGGLALDNSQSVVNKGPESGNESDTTPPALEPASEPDPDRVWEVRVRAPGLERIGNPAIRLLQRQAYAGRVPLAPGLSGRAALLDEIAARSHIAES